MSLKVACDVKSPQTTFTTGNITLERIFWKQEEQLLFFGSVSGFIFVLYLVYPVLPVSLDCPFGIF
jgi:uncharacterized membrane protein